MKIRDGLGRFAGSIADYYFDNEESWEDHKESDLRFPNYHKNLNGECITYHISELNKN
jgi:hypothetical protein